MFHNSITKNIHFYCVLSLKLLMERKNSLSELNRNKDQAGRSLNYYRVIRTNHTSTEHIALVTVGRISK